jgi:5'-nucleotidase
MPTILITNDDGAHDPGLLALKQALSDVGDVVVLAPERNRSAISHAITMHKPLRIFPVTLADGSQGYTCSGTPADCVRLAAGGVLDVQPDLVVSGINAGHNLGSDVYYSGTVACAREAIINGLPAIAVSSVFPRHAPVDIQCIWRTAADMVRRLAQQVLQRGLPPQTLLNVNVPGMEPEQIKGVRITRVGSRAYKPNPVQRHDPFGRAYYWPSGIGPFDEGDEMSDVGAVAHGYISITPIQLDVTHYDFAEELKTWDGF